MALGFGTISYSLSDALYNMTMGPSGITQATINGAVWQLYNPVWATGSGTFNSFLRVQNTGSEKGYNTDWRPVQFNELTSEQFTYAFPLAAVPQIVVEGKIYREFQLDINETKGLSYLSLDSFQVWLTNKKDLHNYDDVN